MTHEERLTAYDEQQATIWRKRDVALKAIVAAQNAIGHTASFPLSQVRNALNDAHREVVALTEWARSETFHRIVVAPMGGARPGSLRRVLAACLPLVQRIAEWVPRREDPDDPQPIAAEALRVIGETPFEPETRVDRFARLMQREIDANAPRKGPEGAWDAAPLRGLLDEISYHQEKLRDAALRGDLAGVEEYAADVANMAMMVHDAFVAQGLARLRSMREEPT